jgi:hypothetical protein
LEVHQGGDYRVATAYFSRGEGAVRDVDGQSFNSPPEHFKETFHIYYPNTVEWFTMDDELNGIDLIKQKIMENGVLATCMCYSGSYINNFIHYQPPSSNELPNHSVAIIGWDDNKITQAPLPGAWLVKNSWGTSWGFDGYFWISYYDKWACREPDMGAVSFFNVQRFYYNKVYYHDYHGWRDTKPNTTEAFNAFEATSNDFLKAVSFFVPVNDVDYTVKIYGDFSDGQLQNELSTISGHIYYKSFQTIQLQEPVNLNQGEKFYIYLYLSDGGIPYDRTSDVPVLLGANYRTIVNSTANPQESYYSENGEWKDFYYYYDSSGFQHTGNFCIKGLAVTAYDMKIGYIEIDDSEGNNNGSIDAGETVNISITIKNKGVFDVSDISGEFTTDDEYTTINNGSVSIDNLQPDEEAVVTINISASAETPVGHLIEGNLNINCQSNGNSFNYNFNINLLVGLIFENFESGDFSHFNWELSGDADWIITTNDAYEGNFSAKSGEIPDQTNTDLSLTLDILSDGTISFYRKISSEFNYDFLKFYIDDDLKDEWSGEKDWEMVSYDVQKGEHTFKWTYVKDYSVSDGDDCAWIDYIIFPPVNVNSTLNVNIIANPGAICKGDSSQLITMVFDGSGSYTYSWTPATGLNATDISNPVASPDTTTTYTVVVSDGIATGEAEITITVYQLPQTPVITQEGNMLLSSSENGNQWYDSDGAIEGATNQTFYPDHTDSYYVIVTNENGCTSEPSNVINFVYTSTTELKSKIKLYPNPAKDVLHISFPENTIADITIFSITGKLMFVQNNVSSTSVDLTTYDKGLYFVRLKNDKFNYIAKIVVD